MNTKTLFRLFASAACALTAATSFAAEITFELAPFQGSTANPDDGVRTVFGTNERTLPTFDSTTDRFVFSNTVYSNLGPLNFLSAFASSLNEDANLIILLNSDNDNNPATVFNAGAAANLIANALSVDRPGLFMYFNSALGVNRLVYSSNLNSTTADLAILARIASPTGGAAVDRLVGFEANDFQNNAVPVAPIGALLALGLAALGLRSGQRRV
jgi:hypothetical protein